MIKTYKVMLLPNNKQMTKMFAYANVSRYAYNWVIEQENKSYQENKTFVQDGELRKLFTQYKKQKENEWLYRVSNEVTKQAIKDACSSYIKFFKGKSEYPRFKSKRKSKPSFFQDSCKIKVTETQIKVEGFTQSKKSNKQKINWIRLAERNRIPTGVKYYNPRFTFDGINWWVTVGVEEELEEKNPSNEGIGIDLGIKDLAICSDEIVYSNINKAKKLIQLDKKTKRIQRSISRSYENNKEGGKYRKTKNIKKKQIKFLRLNHKVSNIRHNFIHQMTSEIIRREPSFIVIEDLNVKGMMKNKHLSKAIQVQCFREIHRQLEYKCEWNNIRLVIADRFYPSSKKCCKCGNIKHNLKLSNRIYRCDVCGNIIDRDYQASVNLRNYALI